MNKIKTLRIIFREMNGEKMVAETLNKQSIEVICSSIQLQELNNFLPALPSGVIFNLLNAKEISANAYEAEFLIFEPDYLIDASTLAECFRPYGNHFLNYTFSRLQNKEISPAILLGNTANFFIDELVNEDEEHPVNFTVALKKMFRTYAFELTVCKDLKEAKTETGFFENCRKHFNHIRHAVNEFFPKAGIDKEFEEQVRGLVQPGTSCLFLMIEKATPDKAVEAMSKYGGTVLKTSLSKQDEEELQDALHGSGTPAQ